MQGLDRDAFTCIPSTNIGVVWIGENMSPNSEIFYTLVWCDGQLLLYFDGNFLLVFPYLPPSKPYAFAMLTRIWPMQLNQHHFEGAFPMTPTFFFCNIFFLELLPFVLDLGMIPHQLIWKCLGQLCCNFLPMSLLEVALANSQKILLKTL